MRLNHLVILVLAGAAVLATGTRNVEGQNCAFTYTARTNGPVYAGSTYTLSNMFTNTGSVDILVTSIRLSLDFGTYDAPSQDLPLPVPATGPSIVLYFDIQIPSDASVGDHTLTVTVGFMCLESGGWVTPSQSPIVSSSTQSIMQNPATVIAQGVYGVTIAGAVAVAGMIAWILLRRTRAPLPPEPSRMPSLPPSETPTS